MLAKKQRALPTHGAVIEVHTELLLFECRRGNDDLQRDLGKSPGIGVDKV